MRWRPTAPERLARPSGKYSEGELSNTCAVPSVDAHRNTTRAWYDLPCLVFASMTRTPDTRFLARSKSSFSTMASVTMVRLPVFSAAGRVADNEEKYAP